MEDVSFAPQNYYSYFYSIWKRNYKNIGWGRGGDYGRSIEDRDMVRGKKLV